jgi:hypothetical protein
MLRRLLVLRFGARRSAGPQLAQRALLRPVQRSQLGSGAPAQGCPWCSLAT